MSWDGYKGDPIMSFNLTDDAVMERLDSALRVHAAATSEAPE